MTTAPRVMVVGLGVSGMATAIRLRQAGWEPVIVEKAPERRKGGYFIVLFGTGRAAAERLGIRDSIHVRTPERSTTWEVDRYGNRSRGAGLLDRPGEPEAVLRGDIEQALFESLGDTEVRYGTTPTGIRHLEDGAEVTTSGPDGERTEVFDLVVGADGMRSTVRELVFAPAAKALRPMGTVICAFALEHQITGYEPDDSVVLAEPGRSLWTFPFSDHAPTALFSYRPRNIDAQFTRPPIEVLREAYGPAPYGAMMEEVFDQLGRAENYLFDSVNQVKIDTWHKGRVVVLGDAAWCVTLYASMGASSGLAGASLLGDLLERHPDDVGAALDAWEAELRPFIDYHQRMARVHGQFFTPGNRIMDLVRTFMMRRAGAKLNDADHGIGGSGKAEGAAGGKAEMYSREFVG